MPQSGISPLPPPPPQGQSLRLPPILRSAMPPPMASLSLSTWPLAVTKSDPTAAYFRVPGVGTVVCALLGWLPSADGLPPFRAAKPLRTSPNQRFRVSGPTPAEFPEGLGIWLFTRTTGPGFRFGLICAYQGLPLHDVPVRCSMAFWTTEYNTPHVFVLARLLTVLRNPGSSLPSECITKATRTGTCPLPRSIGLLCPWPCATRPWSGLREVRGLQSPQA
jgi:hypothetical protein